MISTPIMIVGAGPTGLMLSAQLHRFGTPHVIADKKPGITTLSKALAVQARTLEYYRQLGIVDHALDQGFIAGTANFVVNGRVRAALRFGELGTGISPYPYVFILEQSRNEQLLLDHISAQGGSVRWGAEVCALKSSADGYAGTLKHADGAEEEFECRYLVGCGGAGSPVRHFLDMPFRGSTNEQRFFVADVTVEFSFEKQGIVLAVNGSEFFGFFPMTGAGRYRAIGILPPEVSDPDNFPFAALKDHIERHIGIAAKITGHSWHSGYRVHHRIVDSFRSGNAFLVGDAAHIHSPAGGQGMNTGLGDAVNLGWKLAAVVNGWSDEAILDSYDKERRPFGVRLVHTTDKAFVTMVSKAAIPRLVRSHILPVVLKTVLTFDALRKLLFKTLSQTGITYRQSILSDGSSFGTIRAGDRFPWFEWDAGNSFDWLRSSGYVVLLLGDAQAGEFAGWSGPVKTVHVSSSAADAAVASGLPASGYVVVRPDMHIASIGTM